MLTRVLSAVGGAAGLLLGVVGAEAAIAGVMFGGLAGALVTSRALDLPAAAHGGLAAVGGPLAGLITGVAVLAGCLALAGLVTLLGPASGIVLMTLVLVAVAGWWLRRSGAPRRGGDVEATEDSPAARQGPQRPVMLPPPGVPATLSTEQLCMAWQASYFTLLDTPAGPARCHVVALREGLLDELERRDRAGFTRWLDADARANSNPSHYLDADERPAA